jgi:16S rRNA (uracil1498-N3)-methyltransferase
MRVFLLPGEAVRSRRVEITGKDFHYLARVLRLKEGDCFRGTDGGARQWVCRIARLGSSSMEALLEEPQGAARVAKTRLTRISLLQVLPKGRKMDGIVRQATEAGVSRIVPLLGRNSLYRFDSEEDVQHKLRRWRKLAREALQQSGAPELPVIEGPRALQEAVDEAEDGEVRLVFHPERRESRSLHDCLAGNVRAVCLVIGPEGGLSDEELDYLVSRGFTPVTAGTTVLRTETAAVYAVAAIQTILQERETWRPSQ